MSLQEQASKQELSTRVKFACHSQGPQDSSDPLPYVKVIRNSLPLTDLDLSQAANNVHKGLTPFTCTALIQCSLDFERDDPLGFFWLLLASSVFERMPGQSLQSLARCQFTRQIASCLAAIFFVSVIFTRSLQLMFKPLWIMTKHLLLADTPLCQSLFILLWIKRAIFMILAHALWW